MKIAAGKRLPHSSGFAGYDVFKRGIDLNLKYARGRTRPNRPKGMTHELVTFQFDRRVKSVVDRLQFSDSLSRRKIP